MNMKVTKNLKNHFFKLMNHAVFGKPIKNVRLIKLVTTKGRRNYLLSEPNYLTRQ